MPHSNDSRRLQGGSVPGFTRIAVTNGEGIDVATSCFDPGYSLETTFEGGDPDNKISRDALVRGYIATGRLVGGRGR